MMRIPMLCGMIGERSPKLIVIACIRSVTRLVMRSQSSCDIVPHDQPRRGSRMAASSRYFSMIDPMQA
jgi:hypothetical protein